MVSTIRKFRKLLSKQQQKKLLLLGLIMLGGAFLEVIGVSMMLPITTAIIDPEIIHTNKVVASVCTALNIQTHKAFILLCIVLLIIVFIVKNVYLLFEYYARAQFVYNNRLRTQRQLLHSFLNRSYEFFLTVNSSEIMRTLNNDVVYTFNLLMTLLTFFAESIVSIALIITVFIIAPTMTLLIFAMLAILVFIIIKCIKPTLRTKGVELREHTSLTYKWLLQSIQGIKDIKIAQKEDFFENKYYESSLKTTSSAKWQTVFNNTPRLLIETGCICSTLTVIAILIYRGQQLEELIPALAAFAMAAVKLMPSANHIINASSEIAYYGPSIDKLLENIAYQGETKSEHALKRDGLTLKDRIELCNITYIYPNTDVKILDNASLSIPSGSCVGLIGKSGAGKTTLVDVLLGLLTPQTGTITSDGENVMDKYEDWLSHIGYIPQSIFMLDGTIADNVAFGNEVSEEKVWAALEEAQLADYVRTLPEKGETVIGERGIRLSGGQLQRIGIARALYNDPELLIFDEATSSLDNETETAIIESIEHLHGKKTMIIIAHRLQTIENCDSVFEVVNGKICDTHRRGD